MTVGQLLAQDGVRFHPLLHDEHETIDLAAKVDRLPVEPNLDILGDPHHPS